MIKNGGKNKPVVKGKELKALIRTYGIPPGYRPKIWMECSGCYKKITENRGYYKKMLSVHDHHQSEAQNQIDLDLERTFPEHPFFQKNSEGLNSMRRILIAYSWRNPLVAYAQSLNYIVGMLLLHYNEEEAFWMLVIILEEILPANFYSPDLVGVRTECKVLDELLKDRVPKVSQHFSKLQIETGPFTIGWIMRLYVGIFPHDTTLRIWDVMFNEGSKVILRSALAVLKMHETNILKLDDFGYITQCVSQKVREQFDEAVFMKNCFSFLKLTRETVIKLRKEQEVTIREETRKLEESRKAYKQRMKELEEEGEKKVDTTPKRVYRVGGSDSIYKKMPDRPDVSPRRPELSHSTSTGDLTSPQLPLTPKSPNEEEK